MVYVDTVNGVDNSSCQLGEIELYLASRYHLPAMEDL